MKILIIGATGNAGSRVVTEALRRQHHVTAASRRSVPTEEAPRTPVLVLDATDPMQVARAARPHDVVVAATRPARGQEADVVAITTGLAEGARQAERRLVVVGGASPLFVPGTARRALDDPAWVPTKIRDIAAASSRQLEVLQTMNDIDWTYLAPAAVFQPGPRTGTYRTGGNQLVVGGNRQSLISMEDYAIALLDEIETPTTRRAVLSTGY